VLALQGQPWSDSAITALCQALVSALLMNISIVGINQCFDVEIDKINKPYLPLASGEFSMATGIAIVAVTAVLSLLTGAASGSGPLFCTLAGSLVLGIVYSADLPFMRWKRFPYLAAACILAVRAVMVQLGFYHHIKQAVGAAQLELTRPLLFTVGFMLLFSVVIALFKDIPDVKGDTQAGVRTFSVRAGVERVFWVCVGILAAAYAGGIAFGLSSADVCSRVVVAAGHAAFAGLLLWRARQVDLQQTDELVDYYMFIWKLFYAEYLLIPFFR
jgi:homogentisate phytyltransferase/homogentisate geranylgeranyltransferase